MCRPEEESSSEQAKKTCPQDRRKRVRMRELKDWVSKFLESRSRGRDLLFFFMKRNKDLTTPERKRQYFVITYDVGVISSFLCANPRH
jgi:hypothetical protein